MKKYLLAIGLALLQTTFSMARDHAPAQNEGFEKEDYMSQENRDFANTNDLVGARNAKIQAADIMQRDEGCTDYDANDKRWGRKKADDMMSGDNCCKPKCPKPCCPKPKCKPKCCPKPKCCKPKCCPKPPKAPCCPKPKCCKPKCPKPKCCKPCEPLRQPACTQDGCCEPVREPACTQDGCCEPRRMMQTEKPKCCKPKTCCKRKPKCCDQDMMINDQAIRNNNRSSIRDRNNMMNPRDRSAARDM